MNYIKQILGEIREQPLAVWLSVGGTALSIFLVMAVFIVNDLPSVEAKPESCRRSLMVGEGMNLSEGENDSSSSLSKKWAEKLYGNLEGIEKSSYFNPWLSEEDVAVGAGMNHTLNVREADDAYWDIFEFDFISGKPYSKAENEANMKVAVLSEKTARTLFGSTDVVGREFMLMQIPYRVAGVIKSVNPLFSLASGDVYIPLGDGQENFMSNSWMGEYFGNAAVLLLRKKGVSEESIKAQVRKRYEAQNAVLNKEGRKIIYHETPYSMEVMAISHGTNTTPDPNAGRMMRWTIYGILLLVPAINLSGMTRSRLRRRVAEIGVRRAFGATRFGVVGQLLGENLIVTLLGGALGLLFCVLFIMFFSNLFINLTNEWFPSEDLTAATPTFSMIFTWKAFGFAAIFCFFLNLISAGLPVWKAASVNPAEAISGNENFKK